MSLASNIVNLATDIATEAKSLRTLINGNQPSNAALLTTSKTNLVASINELFGMVTNAGAQIDDSTTAGSTVWSSNKTAAQIASATAALVAAAPGTLDTLNELAAALGDDANFVTTINTALGNRVRYDAAQTLTTAQQAQARANIAAGTSSVVVGTGAGQAADAAATTTALGGKAPTVHGHALTDTNITGVLPVAQLPGSTVGKAVLAAADAAAARTAIGAGTGNGTSNLVIGTTAGTAADAAATTTALGGKAATSHSHTVSQLSDGGVTGRTIVQAATAAAARTTIDVYSKAEVGEPETDFVAVFRAGLV